MSRAANSGGRILIGHGLEDEHLRCGPALFLLRRRVHGGGPPVDSQAVNLRLHREVLQLSETARTVHLKYGDCATGAGHIDASEPGIEHHDVRALGHWQMSDRPVRVEIEHRQRVVAFAGEERAMMFGIDCHAVVLATSLDGITGDRKSTRLNSSHSQISYAVFCLKKKKYDYKRVSSQPTLKTDELSRQLRKRPCGVPRATAPASPIVASCHSPPVGHLASRAAAPA